MQKEKTLILVESDSTNIFTEEYKKNGYYCEPFFKEVNKPLRAIRRFWINYLPNKKIWFFNWKKELLKYDCLIINVNRLTNKCLKEVLDLKKDIRIIGWYWNTVDETNKPLFFNKNIEYWSFDAKDCEKYGFKNNIQFYAGHSSKEEKINDIYFVGRNKGREETIKKIEQICNKEKLKYDFHIINNDKELLPYEKVKEQLAKSKAVLEINKDNQVGYTLRVLESLFFEIKLVTNNKKIISAPFYIKDNIFVIGLDDFDNLNEFINGPYNHLADKYKNDYSLDAWFNNFN